MKKIISTLFVAVTLMFAGVQSAQAQFGWGVKGGLNLQKADFENATANLNPENFTGFFIGPMAEFTIPIIGLGVDGALLYSQTGMSFTGDDGVDETLKSHSLEVPINLKYSIGLGSLASVYAAAGPQFALALSQDWMEEVYGLLYDQYNDPCGPSVLHDDFYRYLDELIESVEKYIEENF